MIILFFMVVFSLVHNISMNPSLLKYATAYYAVSVKMFLLFTVFKIICLGSRQLFCYQMHNVAIDFFYFKNISFVFVVVYLTSINNY